MKFTANTITFVRIFLLPLPIFLIFYGSQSQQWIAFILFTLLGMTDFIDGYLARKNGPTPLGGLIDPVADKIFIVAIAFLLCGSGVFPVWIASVVISRELLITALRTSIAIRGRKIKTSVFSKLKTIIQMGGFGTIFLTLALSRQNLIIITFFLSFLFSIAFIFCFLKGKNIPYYIIPVLFAFIFVATIRFYVTIYDSILLQISIVVGITWLSCIEYLIGSYKIFIEFKKVFLFDLVRLYWVFSFAFLFIPLFISIDNIIFPALFIFTFEFFIGGIDNILASKKNKLNNFIFFFSSLLMTLLFILDCLNDYFFYNIDLLYLIWISFFISIYSLLFSFYKFKNLFIYIFCSKIY